MGKKNIAAATQASLGFRESRAASRSVSGNSFDAQCFGAGLKSRGGGVLLQHAYRHY